MTHREALDLNTPCPAILTEPHEGVLPAVHSFMETDAESTALEAVKQAESGRGWIVRMVERHGRNACVTVRFKEKLRNVSEVNLLEREPVPVPCDGRGFRFEIKPYEIKTFLVKK